MGRGKMGFTIKLWGLVLFTLVYLTPQTMSSKDQNKTCISSHCGIITDISDPFRLRADPPNCGHSGFQLYCEKNVTLLHSGRSTYQVLGINYDNYTIRLRDTGIREGDYSSLPHHFLSRFNFSTNFRTVDDGNDGHPYHASLGPESNLEMTFDHVIYLNCSDLVRDDAGYVDTADYVDWGSKGEGRGHVYAVVGDLEAGRLKPECRVKSVAAISLEWSSLLKGKNNYSYADIHTALSHGFVLSWWRQACSKITCPTSEACLFFSRTQKVHCSSSIRSFCYGVHGVHFPLLCAFLAGIFEGLPQSLEDIHYDSMYWMADLGRTADKHDGAFISIQGAFRLGKITGRYVLPYTTSRFLFGILFLFILIIYIHRRRHLSIHESIEDFIRLHNLHPIRYSYKDLKTMTNGFKNNIGKGGYGMVYKGKLKSGYDVAVKMLGNKSNATCQDFMNEVATIGRIHHFNVVRLAGFCVEGTKRALLYEFMSNGSLDKHIFSKERDASLSYRKIYEISLGVAHGIAYLHHGCDMKILHFDIKPNNILLDNNLTPKISDFGLARLYSTDDSIATLTAARGTIGYMAPELFYKNIGKVSHKSDIYSFGKLLMEMASQIRNSNPHAEHSSQIYFPSWIYDQFDEEKSIEMEGLTEEEKTLAKKMFIVALWCIQFNPTDRPSMNRVIEMLEVDDVESLEMPQKPSIYPEDHQPNCDQTTSSFSISSYDNLGEEASDKK